MISLSRRTGQYQELQKYFKELTEEKLDTRTSEILVAYFCDRRSYEDIAKKFCLTRERVRQIAEKGIRVLRHGTRGDYLWSWVLREYFMLWRELLKLKQ